MYLTLVDLGHCLVPEFPLAPPLSVHTFPEIQNDVLASTRKLARQEVVGSIRGSAGARVHSVHNQDQENVMTAGCSSEYHNPILLRNCI